MDLYRTRICLSLRSHIFRKCFGMYGVDDGARTRDLCRDRAANERNLLTPCPLTAKKGNQKHSKSLKYTRYEVSEPSLKQRVQSFDDRLNHHMLIQAE